MCQLDPQHSALPHSYLLLDLQGTSFNWKQVKSLFLCWNLSHHWVSLTVAGFAGKQKPVCQNMGRKHNLSNQNLDSPSTDRDDQGWDFCDGFFACVISKCAAIFPPVDNPLRMCVSLHSSCLGSSVGQSIGNCLTYTFCCLPSQLAFLIQIKGTGFYC